MSEERIEWLEMGRLMCKAELETISQEEQETLDRWLAADPARQSVRSKVVERLRGAAGEEPVDAEKAWKRFSRAYRLHDARNRRLLKYAAAVAILLVLGGGYFMLKGLFAAEPEISAYAPQSDVILILDDGRQFDLTTDPQKIAIADNVELSIDEKGIYYDILPAETAVHYNTIQVPEFGYYTMILADGSTVILNSSTRLRYPVPFEKGKREVWLSGEAYFDVAPDEEAPFTVHFALGQVKVLGTSFNVRARGEDNDVEATLVEGSVECSNGTATQTLSPGYQAVFDRQGGRITSQQVDIRVATAWTRGQFYFKNESLANIMDELARWYNVEVAYDDPELTSQIFTLEINRFENLNKILDVLVKTERIRYKQSGQKITILR